MDLVKTAMMEEIRHAFNRLGDSKVSGIDNFKAKLSKFSWEVVGHDVTKAVQDLFFKVGL